MFKLEKLTDKAVLTIYGYVGGYYMDFRSVNSVLDDIAKSGYTKLDFRMHTLGGGVIDGNLIFNFIAGFKGEVDVYIDGLAASMGSIIMLAGTRIHIAENGFVMIHAPSGGGYGNAKDFIQQAKLLKSMEKNFIAKLMQRTGKSEKEVSQWMDGTDYWFDADEAIALGLVDDKFSAKVQLPTTLETTEAAQLGTEAVFNRYVALTQEIPTINNDMKKEELIARYQLTGVTADSTDEQVMAAIDAKVNANKDAETQAKAAARLAIETIVDTGIAAGKFGKDKRDTYIARGEKIGAEELKAIIDDMQAYNPITAQIKGGAGGANPEERKGWTWADYQAKAPDELEAMPKANPELFKALYKAEYKSEPEL